jgi:hypothetical protein
MLRKAEVAIENEQSRDTSTIWHRTQDEDKQNSKTQQRKLKCDPRSSLIVCSFYTHKHKQHK